MSVFAGEIVGVLAHVERADENGAGPLQSLDQRGVARRFGVVSRLLLEPATVGMPSTSNKFLTANGTPASGPRLRPWLRARSIAAALARARSTVTVVKALSFRLSRLILASAASVTASALRSPLATACAIFEALAQLISAIMC